MLRGDLQLSARRNLKVRKRGTARQKQMPAIDQRRVRRDQLNRRGLQVITFAQRIARIMFPAQQLTLRLKQSMVARQFAETETTKRIAQRLFAETFAKHAKVVVARIGDRCRRIQWRQVPRVRTNGVE